MLFCDLLRTCAVHGYTDFCMQAAQMCPQHVKAQYREAQACMHLQQYQQCLDTCKAALKLKPSSKQLQQLAHLAEKTMRVKFMVDREPEVDEALIAACQAALQQVSDGSVPNALAQAYAHHPLPFHPHYPLM